MKHYYLKPASLLLALILLFQQSVYPAVNIAETDNSSPIFNEDIENEIYTRFESIQTVFDSLQLNENSPNIEGLALISLESTLPLLSDDVETKTPPMGIPSFLWGCAFGLTGMIIVYLLTDRNKMEVKKAFDGCVVSYIVVGFLCVVFYIYLPVY
jgi:hypothetical protein